MRCIVAISLSSEECWRLCDAFEPDTQRSLGLSALSASPAPSVTFCPFSLSFFSHHARECPLLLCMEPKHRIRVLVLSLQ